MPTFTTITPKFQIHIPVEIRKKLGITTHGKARVSVEKGRIIIEPLKSKFMSLKGKYKVKNPIRVEKIREQIDYTA
jgi:AbrB family looped-hinge helix DNA binding protein